MGNFFKPIVNANSRLLRIVLAVNIAQKQSTLSDCGAPDDYCFKVLEILLLELTHKFDRYYYKSNQHETNE